MSNEDRYKECLLHVISLLRGVDSIDAPKPVSAEHANNIAHMAYKVVMEDKTTEEAINEVNATNPKTNE